MLSEIPSSLTNAAVVAVNDDAINICRVPSFSADFLEFVPGLNQFDSYLNQIHIKKSKNFTQI